MEQAEERKRQKEAEALRRKQEKDEREMAKEDEKQVLQAVGTDTLDIFNH